ncbi:MAG: hypothetical protein JSV66_00645 [Trueperaceae bacterium]|nr:MAG: hypothetical protein JSV66_00645 [Trueperaceae bacterium]
MTTLPAASGFFYLEGFEVKAAEASLHLGYGKALELGLRLHDRSSFGPVGTFELTVDNWVNSDRQFQASVSADGVFGRVAAEAGIQLFNTDPISFDIESAVDTSARPRFEDGQLGAAVGAGVRYRIGRRAILINDTSLYLLSGQVALRLRGELQRPRIRERDDATILLLTFLEPGLTRGFAAVGGSYTFRARNLPLWKPTFWLGLGPNGIEPGTGLSIRQRARGTTAEFNLALEPFRTDIYPYRAQLSIMQPFGEGSWRLSGVAALGRGGKEELLALTMSYHLPISR